MHFISQRTASHRHSQVLCLSWDGRSFQVRGAATSPSKPTQSFPVYLCFQLPFLSKLSVSSPECHSLSQQRGHFSCSSTSGGRARVTWLNLTLGRKPKILPSKSLSREVDRQQKLVKTRSCAVGKGNVLREVLCLFLGRNRMSLVRACCSQQRARPGRDGAGHAWLSSTSCPRRDVLFSWQSLLLLYGDRDGDCCFSQSRSCQSHPPSLPTAPYFSAHITSHAHHEIEVQPSPVFRKDGITYFSSTLQSGELKMPRCFLYPSFQSRPHVQHPSSKTTLLIFQRA